MLSKSEIKYIQSLQQKKFRDEHHAFVAEGPKLVKELMATGAFRCLEVFSVPQAKEELALPAELYREINEVELDRISGLQAPNKVLALFEKRNTEEFSVKGKITLLLDDIQDPGNLGTIIRICDWFGIRNMVCSPGTADAYNPKVVQSTMASLGRVNLMYTDPATWLAQQQGISKIAAVLGGENLRTFAPLQEAILMIGNESKGLSDQLMRFADERITIPGSGTAESLNAAVASGIMLYHLTGAAI